MENPLIYEIAAIVSNYDMSGNKIRIENDILLLVESYLHKQREAAAKAAHEAALNTRLKFD